MEKSINNGLLQRMMTTEKRNPTTRRFDIVLAASLGFLLNSILRGIRTPGRWAYTHLLFNYDFGFTKRALLGTIISVLHIPYLYSYDFCFWFSVVIFVADIALIIRLFSQLQETSDALSKSTMLLFSSSLAVVYLAHTIGYFDHIALLVSLLILMTNSFYKRVALVSILFPIVLLIHEAALLVFFPVICFRFVVDLVKVSDRSRRATLCALIVGISVFVLVLGRAQLTEAAATAMYHSLQSKADYPLRKDAFLVPTLSLQDNFRLTYRFWQLNLSRHYFLSSMVVTAPTTLYMLCMSVKRLSGTGRGLAVRYAAIAASLAPLSLHTVGVDFARWSTLATTTSFLTFAIVALEFRLSPSASPVTPQSAPLVSGILIAFNLGSSVPLFDGYVVQSFPYEEHIDYLRQLASGRRQFPPQPEQCIGSACVTVIGSLCPQSAIALSKWKADDRLVSGCIDRGDDLLTQPWMNQMRTFLGQL